MKTYFSPRPIATASALALILAACGGGGGGGDSVAVTSPPPTGGGGGGIGGSGQSTTSSGTIDGFGSIFVNGVRFDTDDADVIINGEVRGEDALRLGMVVLVSGEVDDDGVTGIAERVLYDNELEGPIAAIQVSPDGNSKLLTILGINVIVEKAGTVFDDVTFDTLAVNDVVEVSGFIGRGDSLRATRVERESRFVAGQSQILVRGTVGLVSATEFVFGDLSVDFSAADLVDFPDGTIAEGQSVKVRGTLNGTLITANQIEFDEGKSSRFEQGETVRVQGAITRFVTEGSFRVGGVDVDASSAVLRPADLRLGNGAVVQIEGIWNGSTLEATQVDSRRGRIKIEAPVSDIGADSVTLELAPGTGTVTVQVDLRTRFDDDTDQVDNLTLADISVDDFLEVEAFLDGDTLFATTIDRDDDDDHVLQGPVQSFDAMSREIQILGLTYATDGAEFEDRDDNDITSDVFFASVQLGDLVKIKDEEIANGTANEVEFEDRDALEGEREFACFGDDDSMDDDSVDDSSDGCDDFSDDEDLTDGDDGIDDDLADDDDLIDDDDDEDDDDVVGGDDDDDLAG